VTSLRCLLSFPSPYPSISSSTRVRNRTLPMLNIYLLTYSHSSENRCRCSCVMVASIPSRTRRDIVQRWTIASHGIASYQPLAFIPVCVPAAIQHQYQVHWADRTTNMASSVLVTVNGPAGYMGHCREMRRRTCSSQMFLITLYTASPKRAISSVSLILSRRK
jgi:hypothetical protein